MIFYVVLVFCMGAVCQTVQPDDPFFSDKGCVSEAYAQAYKWQLQHPGYTFESWDCRRLRDK